MLFLYSNSAWPRTPFAQNPRPTIHFRAFHRSRTEDKYFALALIHSMIVWRPYTKRDEGLHLTCTQCEIYFCCCLLLSPDQSQCDAPQAINIKMPTPRSHTKRNSHCCFRQSECDETQRKRERGMRVDIIRDVMLNVYLVHPGITQIWVCFRVQRIALMLSVSEGVGMPDGGYYPQHHRLHPRQKS